MTGLSTRKPGVKSQTIPYEIYGGQSGIGAGLYPHTSVSHVSITSLFSTHLPISGAIN